MFQVPPSTRYDLNFKVFGIPVRVHPLFWVIGLLLGYSSGNPLTTLIWVLVLFVSILIHELGHSLMMRNFGVDSFIVLYFGGGLAVPTSSYRSRWTSSTSESNQQILISLAGPFAGFLFAGLVLALAVALGGSISIQWLLGVIPIPSAFVPVGGQTLNIIIFMLLWINIFWGLVNLAPVFPLDGGQVARQIFVRSDPLNGIRRSLQLSVLAGATLAIIGLVAFSSLFMALLFGFMAFQSYQMLQAYGGRLF